MPNAPIIAVPCCCCVLASCDGGIAIKHVKDYVSYVRQGWDSHPNLDLAGCGIVSVYLMIEFLLSVGISGKHDVITVRTDNMSGLGNRTEGRVFCSELKRK